jgi:LCP family protein required for cell wall assembly
VIILLLIAAAVVVTVLVKSFLSSTFDGTPISETSPEDDLAILANQPAPTGQTTILLLGSDQREGDPGYRTDVIVLLLVDADQSVVSAVSFPRDLWVAVPSLYEMKINQVHGIGGFDATAEMMEANFGVRPDYFVLTNFSGFTGIIDRLEGVDVTVEQSLTDRCDLPQAVGGDCTVDPGTVHMDGATALWYIRSRSTSSDYDRLRRAQEVLVGAFGRLMNLKAYKHIPEIYGEFTENVETNMDAAQITSLLPVAVKIFRDPGLIQRFAITEEQATPSWSWNGMWILLPIPDAIQGVLAQAGFAQ